MRTSIVGIAIAGVTGALMAAPVPSAGAQPCPDVEVVFARGTGEPPGVGGVGQAFVDALQSQAAGKSVSVYPVNYAASGDFANTTAFAQTVIDGVRDAASHVQSTAANCPDTDIVLGGYSQGAAVAGFVTAAEVPAGVPAAAVPQPLPVDVADHVAAVTLFGKPSDAWTSRYGAPPITIGPAYAAKTNELCAQGDTICDGTPGGEPSFAHALYSVNGMVGEAATFAAGRL
ncbi:cutinase family protein [Mycolicibacterium sp. 120270]|uniref:cutinase family protein n=1 Tax=Mycolicibacterium sp. 120270 TaxID=3090600 RepID=UPI00299E0030|nr:cutinase family protein [Mycolicibacterium sp. 120270]MDX1883583.1 cutinase family protein [Mycolicibacterium sp. 120270]